MVLSKELPHKRSLHPSVSEIGTSRTFPFSLVANILESDLQEEQFSLKIQLPSSKDITGAEVLRLEVVSDSAAPTCAIFLQMLDDHDRPCSHPFPVCSLSKQSFAAVRIPFSDNQKVKFLLQKDKVPIKGVRISGTFVLDHIPSAAGRERLLKWCDRQQSLCCEVNGSAKASRIGQKRDRSPARDDNPKLRFQSPQTPADPPQLIFAQVTGGDDES